MFPKQLSRLSKQPPKERFALAGLLTLAGVVVSILLFYTMNPPIPLDELGCPESGPVANAIIIVDRTGKIPQSARRAITTNIEAIVSEAPAGTRFSLFEIDSHYMRGLSKALFSRCKTRDGSHADDLTENARMLRRKYEENFLNPFMGILNATLMGSGQERSPVLEALVDVTSVPAFQTAAPTTIYLFSDLLQNSEEYSHYKHHESFEEAVRRAGVNRLIPSLYGAEVRLYYLLRTGKELKMQTNGHVRFWLDYLRAANAEFKTIKKIR
ncbi:hypothetical protein [Pseudodesulfovibrio sp. zrk46]|uniref:hypothetical protein n=1 Tax=Pseudodesulfovibrio sp. zrk46 TaxID=2725288 RepID=UPI0014495C0E|nr:hypothetical protein [Pseudodesulfovibrio sp. zrk46]QJB55629.1 hypothetical protein HFN16_04110 [Pseudodesulfovibrio sp. zrk46]